MHTHMHTHMHIDTYIHIISNISLLSQSLCLSLFHSFLLHEHEHFFNYLQPVMGSLFQGIWYQVLTTTEKHQVEADDLSAREVSIHTDSNCAVNCVSRNTQSWQCWHFCIALALKISQLPLKLIRLITISNLFPLEVVQQYQCRELECNNGYLLLIVNQLYINCIFS